MYFVFQFLSLSKRSHCFSTSCSFSPTHPPCFCLSSRQGRWQRGLFLLIFHDLYFVSSNVEINLAKNKLCCWCVVCLDNLELICASEYFKKLKLHEPLRQINFKLNEKKTVWLLIKSAFFSWPSEWWHMVQKMTTLIFRSKITNVELINVV